MERLAIERGHAFVLVFSVTDKKSFERLQLYYKDITTFKTSMEEIPVMLVGNKRDSAAREISETEALRLARLWKCAYIETSASLNENVRELFEQLFLQEKRESISLGARESDSATKYRRMGKCKCIIM
jgi:GTPase SAR1 family protein